MTALLQSGWMCAFVGALSYLGTTLAVWNLPVASFAPRPKPAAATVNAPRPSWEYLNPELDQLLSDLDTQRIAQEKRARELEALATRLKAERAELDVVMQNLARMQAEFDKNVLRIKDEEVANLKRLAKMYASMAPESAVRVLTQMPDDELVKLFAYMKDADTVAILELMVAQGPDQAKRVAKLTNRMRNTLSRTGSTQPNS